MTGFRLAFSPFFDGFQNLDMVNYMVAQHAKENPNTHARQYIGREMLCQVNPGVTDQYGAEEAGDRDSVLFIHKDEYGSQGKSCCGVA